MPFWVCNYHAVWATKNRTPLITSQLESVIIDAFQHKSEKMDCTILAINMMPDHIHTAVRIPPKIAVADWIGQVKGLSTHEVNAMFPDLEYPFAWQKGYGVLSFGAKRLPFVIDYIRRQQEHHAADTIEQYLEQVDFP